MSAKFFAINFITIFRRKDTNRLRAICPNEMCRGGHPRAILSSKTRRGGACVPARTSAQRRFHTKNTHIVCGEFNDGCAPQGDTGGHTGAAPTHLHQTTRCTITSPHCTFDSSRQPRGVSISHRIVHSIAPVLLPHRGYTFDSAGLASVTQPTLSNNASEGATPLGVVLFLITHHHHTVPNE